MGEALKSPRVNTRKAEMIAKSKHLLHNTSASIKPEDV